VLGELFKLSKQSYVSPYMIAHVYAGLGQNDRALRMLKNAHHERDPHIVDLSYDPALALLRSDPRFTDLLRRVGIAD
jgi:hypothetical protein